MLASQQALLNRAWRNRHRERRTHLLGAPRLEDKRTNHEAYRYTVADLYLESIGPPICSFSEEE
jgi:hypothetical protein